MEDEDLKALFSILKGSGVFTSQEEMQGVIDSEGVGVLYNIMPSGMFNSENEFTETFSYTEKDVEKKSPNGTSEEEVTESVTKTKTVPTGSSDSSSQEPPKTTAVQRAFSKAPPAPKPEAYGSDIMGQGMYENDLSEWQAKYAPARLSAVSEAKDKLAQEERALQQVEDDKQEALSNLESQGKMDTPEETRLRYEAVASDFQKEIDKRQANVVEAEDSIADTEDVFAATNKYMDSDDFKFEQDKLTKEKQEYLEGIDEDFIVDNSAEEIASELTSRYKDKGFTFTSDDTEGLTVTSEYNKKGITLDLGVGEQLGRTPFSDPAFAIKGAGKIIDYVSGERDQQRGVQLDLLRNFLFENQSIVEGTSDEEMSELIETRPYAVSEEEYKKFNERTNAKVYKYKNKLNNIVESYDGLEKVVQQQADELKNKYNVLLETVQKQEGATPEQLEEARNLETLFNNKGYITTEQQQQLEELKNSYNTTQEELKNNIDISRDINMGVGASITQQIKRDEQLGTTTGALTNKFLEGVEDIAKGGVTFGIALVDMLDDIQNNQINNGIKLIYGDKADDIIKSFDKEFKERSKDRKEAIVDSRNFLERILVDNYGSSTTQEYTESEDRSGLMEVTMGVAQSLPAMITTAISGGAGFAAMGLQAFDGVAEEWVNNPEFKNMPLRDLVIIGGSIGAIQGALEKAGFTALVGKSPLGKTITNRILGSVMGKVGKKTTGAQLSRLISAETNSLLKNGVIKIVGGSLVEGETGALQEITDIGLKKIYNMTQGESVFGTPETIGGVVVQVGKGALMEAAGGALMKGALTAPKMVVDGVRGIGMKKDMFNALHFMSDSPELRGSMAKTLKMEILQGRMTKEQAQKTMQSFEEMVSVMRQIPNSTAQKSKAFDLILEQNRLTKEKAGMNPALVKKADERLKEIEAELLDSVEPEVKKEAVDETPVAEVTEFEEASGADITSEDIEKAKAEQEANQVVYEMNKTDKKIWSKDFEILDNRQGQEEALTDEQGDKTSDKWLVLNKVTGDILTVGTKKDAQNVIANAPAYAETFGDGNTVESESIITPAPVAEVTEETVDETPVAEVTEEEKVLTGRPSSQAKSDAGPNINPSAVQPKTTEEQQVLTDEIAELDNELTEGDTSVIIEDNQTEISNIKQILKDDIAENNEEIKKVRADKSLSKEERDERIEEIKDEKEDLKEDADNAIEDYNYNIKEAKKERRAIDRKIKKLKTKLDAIPKQSTETVDVQESTTDSGEVGEGDVKSTDTTQQETTEEDNEARSKKTTEKKIDSLVERFSPKTEEAPAKTRKQKQKTERQVDNAKKALAKVAPEVEIVVHETDAAYREATGEQNRNQSTNGAYNPQTKVININLSKSQENTVAHEVFHALLLSKGMTNAQAQAVTERMLAAVRKVASPDMLVELDKFAATYPQGLYSEESIAELFGILAAEFDTLPKPTQTLIKKWLDRLAKFFGAQKFTDEGIIDLLNTVSGKVASGEVISSRDVSMLESTAPIGNPTAINKPSIKQRKQIEFEESYEMSLVTPENKIDLLSLIDNIIKKDQKVWFWVADQLGLGEYEGVQMDAGPSFALQPENKKKKAIWASGLDDVKLNKNIKKADFIFIISGSPTVSKLFNKKVFDAYANNLGDYKSFKEKALATKPVKAIRETLEEFDSWPSMRRSPKRKTFLISVNEQLKKPNTKFHQLVQELGGFVDLNELRDGFYKNNNFAQNDIMMVLKPSKIGGKSKHSTYSTDILGEVVGVPDIKLNAEEIMPADIKEKIAGKNISEKTSSISPYGGSVQSAVKTITTPQTRKQEGGPSIKDVRDAAKKDGFSKSDTVTALKRLGFTQAEIDESYGVKKPVAKKKKMVAERVLESENTADVVKEKLERLDINYEIENQEKAINDADLIIKKLGIRDAYESTKNGLIRGGRKTVIEIRMLEQLNNELNQAILDGDMAIVDKLSDEMAEIYENKATTETEKGQEISMLKKMYKTSSIAFNVNAAKAKWKKEYEDDMPPTVVAKLTLLEEKIKQKEKELKDLDKRREVEQEEQAVDNIKEEVNRQETRTENNKRVSKTTKVKGIISKLDALEKKLLSGSYSDPTLVTSTILTGIKAIKLSIKTYAKTVDIIEDSKLKQIISEGIKSIKDKLKKAGEKLSDEKRLKRDLEDALIDSTKIEVDPDIVEDGIEIPKGLLYELVESGVDNITDLTNQVYEEIKDDYPGVTKREVRDAITKYGLQTNPTKDEVKRKLASLKIDGSQLSKLEDLAEGKRPRKRSRLVEYTKEQLQKIKEIQRLLKGLPIEDSADIDSYYKSALSSYKTRVSNRLSELKEALKNNEVIKNEKTSLKLDEEAEILKQELELVQKEYNEMFDKTDEAAQIRIETALKRKDTSLRNLLERKEFLKLKGQEQTKVKASKVTSKEIQEIDKKIDKAREEYQQLLEDTGIAESKRVEKAIKQINLKKKFYEDKLKNRDFSKSKPKKIKINSEIAKAKREMLKAKNAFNEEFEKEDKKRRTRMQKIFDALYEVGSLPKGTLASFDLSAAGRQGVFLGSSNPKAYFKSFKVMHTALSEGRYEDFMAELENSANYELMIESGLSITDTSGKVNQSEEIFLSNLTKRKIKIKGKNVNIVGMGFAASERAYSSFLNTLRSEVFTTGVEAFKGLGITPENDPKAYKDLANFINYSTGRGELFKDENLNKFLNLIFFSPRMITSMYNLTKLTLSPETTKYVRKQALKSITTFIGYQGIMKGLLGLSMYALSSLIGDEEEEEIDVLNLDPRDTDFNKLRWGNTRYDTSAGWGIMSRTLARVLTGEKVSGGKTTELNEQYKGTSLSEVPGFFFNKLSPTARFTYNIMTNTHPSDIYADAEDATTYDYIKSIAVPLTISSTIEDMGLVGENKKPASALKTSFNFILNTYGVNSMTYDLKRKRKSTGTPSRTRGNKFKQKVRL